MTDEQKFTQECINNNTWSTTCSALLRTYASQDWLQSSVEYIFKQQVPARDLSNPLPNKLAYMLPDCLISPEACQLGLFWSCARTTLSSGSNSGSRKANANTYCSCFLPSVQPYLECTCFGNVPNLSQPACLNQICQINNVNIDLINSNAENISLSQLCGGQNLQTRTNCQVNNTTLFVDGSKVGNYTISQQCLVENNTVKTATTSANSNNILWGILLLFIILIFACLMLAILYLMKNDVPIVQYEFTNDSNSLVEQRETGFLE